MSYSVDFLFTYNMVNGQEVEPTNRYLLSFDGEDDTVQCVEFDVVNIDDSEQMNIEVFDGLQDLSDEDQRMAYYLLDRWFINNL